jgi:hypothetical protein
MKSLSIHEPARAIGREAGSARLLRDDPREGLGPFVVDETGVGYNLLLAQPVTIRSVFFGHITGLPADAVAFIHAYPEGGPHNIELLPLLPLAFARRGGMAHCFAEFEPFTTRDVYLRIYRSGGGPLPAAGIMMGSAHVFSETFRAQWGHEYGAGRPLDDTSNVERLPSGSFAIDRGVVTGGYQWTFGDLTNEEREQLYAIHRSVGKSRSVLVIEDAERTTGLFERMHWGLLPSLETYARIDPTATTWGMRVADWL